MKIAVLGYGTVGSGVVSVIDHNTEEILESATEAVSVKYILDLRSFPGDPHEREVVHDFETIINDKEISLIAETMGGTEPARTFTERALERGISVVTSNKELVDAHGAELLAVAKAHNCSYLFEASVGGGIPILSTIHTALRSEKIESVTGILNGTTNYILTKMEAVGADFADVLKKAQELGYAEKDPTADVEGHDACRKIAILASLISGKRVRHEDVLTEGITRITRDDFIYARGMQRRIKLLGHAERHADGSLSVLVSPFLIPLTHPLSGVDDVFNAVEVTSNMLGVSMYYGRGAGREATASAVVADICEIARHHGTYVDRNLRKDPATLVDADAQTYRFFVRMQKEDAADTIAALEREGIACRDLRTQFESGLSDEEACVTAPVSYGSIQKALQGCAAPLSLIRLLDV